MKKIISIIIAVILLSFSLGFNAFAVDDVVVTVSDDLQTVYANGEAYLQIDASMLEMEYEYDNFDGYDIDVQLTESQKELIKKVEVEIYNQKIVIDTTIYKKDGTQIWVTYLKADYIEEYQGLLSGASGEWIIDFEYPAGNTVSADEEDLFGESVTLNEDDLTFCDYFYVLAKNDNEKLAVNKGWLIICDDKYYYVDIEKAAIDIRDYITPYDCSELSAYQITGEEFIAELKEAQKRYDSDMNFAFDDKISQIISAVFIVFIFAFVPFIIFVMSLIFVIRTKTIYRKIFATICGLSAAELVIFSALATIIMMANY